MHGDFRCAFLLVVRIASPKKWEWKKRTACRATSELTLLLDGGHVTSYTRFYRRFKDSTCVALESKAHQIWQAGVDWHQDPARESFVSAAGIAIEFQGFAGLAAQLHDVFAEAHVDRAGV